MTIHAHLAAIAFALCPLAAQKLGTDAPEIEWTATFEFGDVPAQKLSDLRGTVVLLQFFGVRSTTSASEIAKNNQLHAEKSELGLVVLGVTSEDAGAVGAYVKKHQVKHPVACGFNKDYDVSGVPDAFLIDKDGKIVWHGHPAAVDMPLLEKALVGAKPAVVLAGLEEAQILRRSKDYGGAYRKAKELLDSGKLSERASAQARDWLQTMEAFVAASIAEADAAEAAKDVYLVWVKLEPVASYYQGVAGAEPAKTRVEAMLADPKLKREIEAGKKVAAGKERERVFDFDGAHALYKEAANAFANTKAGKVAAAAQKAIEKDGKLGYQHTCGYCKAGGAACPAHSKTKKKK